MKATKLILWCNGLLFGFIVTMIFIAPSLMVVASNGFALLISLMILLTIPFMGVLWGMRHHKQFTGIIPYRFLWYIAWVNSIVVVCTVGLYLFGS